MQDDDELLSAKSNQIGNDIQSDQTKSKLISDYHQHLININTPKYS